jgi:hypothetical protein
MNRFLIPLILLLVAGCDNPKDTILPHDIEKMESIKSSIEKLSSEEKELLTGYMIRHTIGAKLSGLFGKKETQAIPDNMTVGKAIDEQRKFKSDALLEEAKQQALKNKVQAEQEAAIKPMREAVTVTLISKKIQEERGYSGIVTDENISVVFAYKNNTDKDISGVKGRISIKDLFGDEISAFQISNDDTIKAKKTITWTGSRSVKYAFGDNNDRKLASLENDKFKVIWEPKIIIFKDGTKMNVPD